MKTIIKVGKIIDGTGAPPQKDMAIIIEENRILDVCPSDFIHENKNVQIFDYPNFSALPGIIDCHDHLAHPGLDLATRFNTPPDLAILKIGKWVTDTLMSGVTSVRDAGGIYPGIKMAVEQGIIPGPRLFIGSVMISQTGGHGDSTQPYGLSMRRPNVHGIPSGVTDGVENCRLKVREIIRLGVDWIKIATTGGIGSARGGPTSCQFTLEEVKALVDEAHKAGKPVMAHAHGGEGLKNCIEAGVDSIEHGTYADEEDLKRMAQLGIWLIPTISVFRRGLLRVQKDPKSVPPYLAAKVEGCVKAQLKGFKKALEFGVPIAMGTDAGAFGHGQNTKELVYMVEAGMTPMQSIVASTSMAAKLLGKSDQFGTIEPKKLADIILLDGDPLNDVSVVADPNRLKMVMKDGVIYNTGK
jgi:imidazolonepropionase-like amidohydrolase